MRDGRSVNFWKDYWVPEVVGSWINPLLFWIKGWLPFVTVTRTEGWRIWRGTSLIILFSRSIVNIMPPSTEPEKDSLAWSKPSDGKFSMKTAYEAVASLSLSHHQGIFKCLHKWKGPERSRSFLWKLFHEKVLTNEKRMKLGMDNNDRSFHLRFWS